MTVAFQMERIRRSSRERALFLESPDLESASVNCVIACFPMYTDDSAATDLGPGTEILAIRHLLRRSDLSRDTFYRSARSVSPRGAIARLVVTYTREHPLRNRGPPRFR